MKNWTLEQNLEAIVEYAVKNDLGIVQTVKHHKLIPVEHEFMNFNAYLYLANCCGAYNERVTQEKGE